MQKTFKLFLIVSNEFFERFCFYTIRGLLFNYMTSNFKLSVTNSTMITHLFVTLSYLFSISGGLIADLYLGRFKTIVYFNLIYLLGNIFLINNQFYLCLIGLLLVSIGTGGVKPCISAFGGDQFSNKKTEIFFSTFYFSINVGSLLGVFISPIIVNSYGYKLAFKISTLLQSISLIIFLSGSHLYTKKPPTNILKQLNKEDLKKTFKIFEIFLYVSFFWMLFDQISSSWIDQGNQMISKWIIPSQMQAINSIATLIFIPLFQKISIIKNMQPLNKISVGMFLAVLSFLVSTILQLFVEKFRVNILLQLPQYLILSAGEVFLSITGLYFAYSESPNTMKSLVFSGWLLTTAVGNALIMVFTKYNLLKYSNLSVTLRNQGFFTILGLIGSICLYLVVKKYKVRNQF